MKYLLDTHAAIWALSDDQHLSSTARAIFAEGEPDALAISDITLFEVALLVIKGRIEIENGLPAALRTMARHFTVLAIDAAIAADAAGLSLPQGDPFPPNHSRNGTTSPPPPPHARRRYFRKRAHRRRLVELTEATLL